ncbi:MAG: DUF4417 domain-containing protein [Ruminococcus sp.]|nr:DUF4417 domain-containing protein [Ruminococcus sp.]
MKKKKNLMKLLDLSYLNVTNRTVSCGELDLPAVYCNVNTFPDYLALYGQPEEYHKTPDTAVCFYQYDNVFDGKNGLFWAIYFDDRSRMNYFKKRYAGVRYFIMPDNSVLGDIHVIENYHRLFRSRVVALWLMSELKAAVIPNVSFTSTKMWSVAKSGLENCSTVAVSSKGHMDDPAENKRLRENVKMVVDDMPWLKNILVYDVCGSNEAVLDTFSYAAEHNIRIIIPDNSLKIRNRLRFEQRQNNRKAVEV